MRSFAISRRPAVAGIVAVGLTPGTAAGAVETTTAGTVPQAAKPQTDKLSRGVISVHTADGNRVSWRLLAAIRPVSRSTCTATSGWDTPRQTDGSLPVLPHLRLAANSALIDRGTGVGLPFSGSAPDLGAFENDGR